MDTVRAVKNDGYVFANDCLGHGLLLSGCSQRVGQTGQQVNLNPYVTPEPMFPVGPRAGIGGITGGQGYLALGTHHEVTQTCDRQVNHRIRPQPFKIAHRAAPMAICGGQIDMFGADAVGIAPFA